MKFCIATLILTTSVFCSYSHADDGTVLESGDWIAVSIEHCGKAWPVQVVQAEDLKITFRNGKFTYGKADTEISGDYEIDSESATKRMNLYANNSTGIRYFCIYRLDGDTLTVCRGRGYRRVDRVPLTARPQIFSTNPQVPGVYLYVFKKTSER